MKAYTFTKTSGGNCYLYNSKKSTLLNVHPIIETLKGVDKNDEKDVLFAKIKDFKISDADKKIQLDKYLFLREKGFFEDIDETNFINGTISAQIVEKQVASIDNILFQVTGNCNLQCRYCCYGDMYTDKVEKQNMSQETVEIVLNYLLSYWTSNKNLSYGHTIQIGFYGGEPLVNFPLIEKIIHICENIKKKTGLIFAYSMTTNAVLLHKYKRFIVEHNFSLLISLDGNETHNMLRVKADGSPSFKTVFNNIKELQQEYQDYFQKKVEFNSVLNKYSSANEVHTFIFNEFGKIPLIETISQTELNDNKREDFQELVNSYQESREMMNQRQDRSPMFKEIGFFFYYQLDNAYKHYCEVLYGSVKQKKQIPTGTCLPFFKKIFITADNRLLTCERISLQHVLGTVDKEVHLDFEKIACKYNGFYEKMRLQCKDCYLIENCGECFLQFPMKDGVPVCRVKMDEISYRSYLSKLFGVLEENPTFFEQINKMIFA